MILNIILRLIIRPMISQRIRSSADGCIRLAIRSQQGFHGSVALRMPKMDADTALRHQRTRH